MSTLFDRDDILRQAEEREAADIARIKKALESEAIFIRAQLVANLAIRAPYCDVGLSPECDGEREMKILADELRLAGFGVPCDATPVKVGMGGETRMVIRVFRDAQAAELSRQQEIE